MAKHEDRGVRDQAGIGPDPVTRSDHLVGMRTMDDFRMAEGEPDVRGWEVYSSGGAYIGDVDDLLIDPDLGQVVMLEIDMKDSAQHGRVPIKAGWLDRDRKRVIIDSKELDRDLLEHRAKRASTTEDVVVQRVDDDTIIVEETRERGPIIDPDARRGEERL
jgi:sporulation protein YlmC with PRC-barrel domain